MTGPVALDYTKLDETVFGSNPIGFPPVGAGELKVTKDKIPEAIYQEISSKEGHLVSSKLPNRFTVVDIDRLPADSHRAAPEDSIDIDDETTTPRL